MSLLDWNGDGKKDIWDTAIEYQIYKSIFEKDDDENDSYDSDSFDDDF
ncbi:MAG: hypothetical protein IJ872_03975 [Eubacterium sp.]|nr:hypothetical protein [Eubacterium sp.]